MQTLKVRVGERWYTVEVGDINANPVEVLVDGEPVRVDIHRLPMADGGPSAIRPAPAAPALPSSAEDPASAVVPAETTAVPETPGIRAAAPVKEFRSPMGGVIVSVAVKPGDQVVAGDEVCVLEAMKMHQSLAADWSGIVRAVHIVLGQQVREGDLLAELE